MSTVSDYINANASKVCDDSTISSCSSLRLRAGQSAPLAADDLSSRAFQLKYDASGITSLKRTGDVADTDYIAANGALGRLIVRYRTSAHGDWKELRDLLATPRAAPNANEIAYALGTRQPSMASRASGSAVQGVAGIRGLNDGLVPRIAPAGGRGGGPGTTGPAADIPIFTWTPSRGATQWVQYTFPAEETIGRIEVFWTAAPQSWRLLYQDGGPMEGGRGGTARTAAQTNAFSAVEFAPVRTMALRIEVDADAGGAAGAGGMARRPGSGARARERPRRQRDVPLQDDILEWTIVLANEGDAARRDRRSRRAVRLRGARRRARRHLHQEAAAPLARRRAWLVDLLAAEQRRRPVSRDDARRAQTKFEYFESSQRRLHSLHPRAGGERRGARRRRQLAAAGLAA